MGVGVPGSERAHHTHAHGVLGHPFPFEQCGRPCRCH